MKKILFIGLLVLFLVSCTSIQEDVMISSIPQEQAVEISKIEEKIANMDASFILEKNIPTEKDFLQIHKSIQQAMGDINLMTAAQARLLALEGRVYFAEGQKNKAKDCYLTAESTYKGDVQTVILGSRLGLVDDMENQRIVATDKPLILLESAIQSFSKGNYVEAVAKFDEAFISLEEFYQQAYGEVRNQAWKMRNIDSSDNAEILGKEKITLMETFLLTQANTDFLFNFVGSKKLSNNELFSKVLGSGLLEATNPTISDSATKNLEKDTYLTRILAARFLWNLRKSRFVNDSKSYAKEFEAAGFSPINDVAVDNQDFDAVVGCVENEIMELVDGINFYPEETIEGIEFKTCLDKLKKVVR